MNDDLLDEATRLARSGAAHRRISAARVLLALVERVRAAEEAVEVNAGEAAIFLATANATRIERDEWKARWQEAVKDAQEQRDRVHAFEMVLTTSIERMKAEMSEHPDREATPLEDLLRIDPNNLADRLAGRAVQYREQRDDLARRLEAVREALSGRAPHSQVARDVLTILDKPFPKREED